jgi:hypothetical protein
MLIKRREQEEEEEEEEEKRKKFRDSDLSRCVQGS